MTPNRRAQRAQRRHEEADGIRRSAVVICYVPLRIIFSLFGLTDICLFTYRGAAPIIDSRVKTNQPEIKTMSKQITKQDLVHTEITIKRPEGHIETVIFQAQPTINDAQFKQIKDGTKAAGRGEVLSYKVIDNRTSKDMIDFNRKPSRQGTFSKFMNEGGEGYNHGR